MYGKQKVELKNVNKLKNLNYLNYMNFLAGTCPWAVEPARVIGDKRYIPRRVLEYETR